MARHLGLYVFTYAAGHFVLQVVGAKWARDKDLDHIVINQRPEDTVCMTPFWPITGNQTWPPPRCLNGDLLDKLVDRWNKLVVPALICSCRSLPSGCSHGPYLTVPSFVPHLSQEWSRIVVHERALESPVSARQNNDPSHSIATSARHTC